MARVSEIMAKDVISCSLKDNVFEVAVIMRDADVGFVPVVDGNRLIGVVTDRDIVIRGVADKNSGSSAVDQVMTKNLVVGQPDMDVNDAARLMSSKEIRRLPIVENDELVGIVALGDIAARDDFSAYAGNALKEISESPQTLN